MSTQDDKGPAFPKEWGWKKYEPALRRWAGKRVMLERARPTLSKGTWEERSVAIANWADDQVQMGRLPTWRDMYSRGHQFSDCFRALMASRRDRRRGDAGRER